ncbi:hypothetical protein [Flavobacterium sp.]|uniref:hypothetical protein n=1 Tax=Flavobacterium sp. TaxID=239 RepID=UPI0039E6626C
MLKLYKRVDHQIFYWETWEVNQKTGAVHSGIVGQKGNYKEVKSGLFSSFHKQIQKEVDRACQDGFYEIDPDDHHLLLIEYAVDAMGNAADLEKRNRLESRLNETLGWTGLGHCDGGSMGSGTMEICCLVVDFDTAKRVIEENLKATEFGNYTRIFDAGEM